MNEWLEIWVRYTGEVEKHGLRSDPWRSIPESAWLLICETNSLVVYEWQQSPTAIGDETIHLVISVKT